MKTRGRSILTALLLAGLVLLCPLWATGAAGDDTDAVNRACNGVVRIIALTEDGSGGTGTGFAVGKAGEPTDIFVTNWHVVTNVGQSADPYGDMVYLLLGTEAFSSGSPNWDYIVPCEVLYTTDGYPDIAILRAERVIHERTALSLLPSEEVPRASTVYALGYPGSSDRVLNPGSGLIPADVEDITVTVGTLSRFTVMETAGDSKVIQHDAHINNGNSGGPLINQDGAVIGVNTYGFGDDAGEWSASIYIDYAMEALDQLGIAYDVYEGQTDGKTGPGMAAAAAAAAVVAAGGGFWYLHSRKRAAPASGAAGVQPSGAAGRSASTPGKPVCDSGLRLQGVAGVYRGRRFAIGERVRIGRDPARNDLVYPAAGTGVSGAHCELIFRGNQLYLRDLGSRNGTYLRHTQMTRLQPGDEVPVAQGDHIYLGSPQEEFVILRASHPVS